MQKVTQTAEHEVMTHAVTAARSVVERAVTLRRAHELTQSAGRAKLTARAWRRGLLLVAAHDEDEVARLDEVLKTRGHLFPHTLGYVHEVLENGGDDLVGPRGERADDAETSECSVAWTQRIHRLPRRGP